MPSLPPPALPPTWAEVLDKVQQALEQTAGAATARAAALDTLSFPEQPASPWRQALEAFPERLQRLHAAVEFAGQAAHDADEALAVAEVELQRWQTAAAATERKLADWAGRAV